MDGHNRFRSPLPFEPALQDLTLCDKSSMLQTGTRAEQPCGLDRDCPRHYAIKEVRPHPQVRARVNQSEVQNRGAFKGIVSWIWQTIAVIFWQREGICGAKKCLK